MIDDNKSPTMSDERTEGEPIDRIDQIDARLLAVTKTVASLNDWRSDVDATLASKNAVIAAKDAEIVKLKDALAALIDVQNGPPLVTYTRDWNAAMMTACELLGMPTDWIKEPTNDQPA